MTLPTAVVTCELVGKPSDWKGINTKTRKLLHLCQKAGYRYVSIGVFDPNNSCCLSWSFLSFDGHIFCSPKMDDREGWPAIWGIVSQCGLHMPCGNRDQAQVMSAGTKQLTKGSYKLPARTEP